MDQYYEGSNRRGWHGWEENQRAGVQYVIDTVIRELEVSSGQRVIIAPLILGFRWTRRRSSSR